MLNRFRLGMVLAAVLAAIFVAGYAVAVHVTPKLASVGQTRYAFASAEDAKITTSTSFVTIPNLAIPFGIPSGKTAEVILTFSGSMNGCNLIEVRGTVDGSAASPSQAQVFWNFGGGADSHSFTFFARGVGSGPHTAAIQWQNPSGCDHAFISARSLVLTINVH